MNCIIGDCPRPGVQEGPPEYLGRCAEHRVELFQALAAVPSSETAPTEGPAPPKKSGIFRKKEKVMLTRQFVSTPSKREPLLLRFQRRVSLGLVGESGETVAADVGDVFDAVDLERAGILSGGQTGEEFAWFCLSTASPRAELVNARDFDRIKPRLFGRR